MSHFMTRAFSLGFAAWETGLAAGITIAARTPMLVGPGRGSRKANRETQLMVVEKMEAAVEGAIAAQTAMAVLCTQMMFGQVRTPGGLADALADIAVAASHPAHSRVRANAKRLVRQR